MQGECSHLFTNYSLKSISFCRACTRTGVYEDIVSGHSKLTEIEEIIHEVKFPAVFYGFAMLYKKLNRYDQVFACAYTEKGLEWFEQGLKCASYNYPGSERKLEETEQKFLLVQLEKLKAECKFPPTPEAVCRQEKCLEVNKDNHIVPSEKIYRTDPNAATSRCSVPPAAP